MPQQIYNFVAINKMESFTIAERGRRVVDVCGIITSADTEVTPFVKKDGTDTVKVDYGL